MKKMYLLAWVLMAMCMRAFTQGEANNWYFGALAGVTFNSGTPVALTNGALSTSEGCAAISDKGGNLLFYTDGIRVYNRNHVQMPNGNGLTGDPSSAQSGIIVPAPGSDSLFYVFTVPATGNGPGICYSVVDMTLDGGMGDIIAATKNAPLLASPTAEKITAVKHANGLFIWVIAREIINSNNYHAYLVDCNGVNAAVTTAIGQVESTPGWGYMVASPNGQKLAVAMSNIGFELFDFNNATGAISNNIFLDANNSGVYTCYGVTFSPDNNLLYGLDINGATRGEIRQWNLQAGSPAAIISSVVSVGSAGGLGGGYRGGAMQIGPDGKIYVCHYQDAWLSVINNPNVIGPGCNHQQFAVDLQGRNAILGLPPFIMSYFDTTAIINYAGVCLGSPTSFSIGGNTSYLDSAKWIFADPSTGAQNFASGLTASHNFSAAGVYNVQLIRYIKCISDTATRQVTIYAPVNLTQNVQICPNSIYTLPGGGQALSPGTYIDSFTSVAGCDSVITTNLTWVSVTVNAGTDTAICPGAPAQLNATGGLTYSWSPTTGLSNPNIANPIVTTTANATYVVSSQVQANNLMINGDFNNGNSGFNSSYAYTPPPNTNEGQYWVSTNAQPWNGGMASCGDHTSGSGNMLLVNGATTPNVPIYCQSVSVLPNVDYGFSTWLMTLSQGNPAQLQFSINGSLLGSVFTANNNTCIWEQFYTTWNSGASTSANICIVNQNTQASANDFALDDMSFSLLCTTTDTVQVNVLSYTDTVDATICSSQVYRLPGGSQVYTAGTYVDTVITTHGCDSVITTNLTITIPSIPVSNDTAVCLGFPAQLNATGGLYTYTWTPATGLSDPNIANPIATPLQTTKYFVTSQVASDELISNGNFNGGANGFSSSYTYTSNLFPASTYYVGSNPNNYHSNFAACTDHTGGNGNMMIVNGSNSANTNIWCQSIAVVPNTDYAFSCWVASVTSGSPAILQFGISGNLLASPFNASPTNCQWQQFYAIWNSGSNTTADICIVNQNTAGGGNDFALDDISFLGMCSTLDSVTVTVNNPSLVVIDTAICDGNVYTFPRGNTSTTALNDTALFADRFGCDSIIITNLAINPSPLTDVYDTICDGQTYTRPSGLTVTITGTYVDTLQTGLGCDSIITTYLTVHPVSATTVPDTICVGSTYTLPDGSTVNVTGVYPVTLTNMFGCDSVVTTNLKVIDVKLSAQTVDVDCYGDSTGSITATATDGLLPYNYDLLLAGNVLSNNVNGAFVNLAAGSYTVNVTDDYGCSATAAAQVGEPPLLNSTASVQDISCYGMSDGEVTVSASGGTPAYTFNLSGRVNSTGTYTTLTAGDYLYTVTDAHGCTDTGSLTVEEPAAIDLLVTPVNATVKLSETIQLHATSPYGPNATYLWSPPNGLSCTNCADPVVTAYKSVQYHVLVTAPGNGTDCTAEGNVPVTVIPNYDLYIPNAFTPNGDGVNDYFELMGNLNALNHVDIKIFNRIGEKVFESNDINFKWDGTYKGVLLQPGVLVYTLRTVYVDEHAESMRTGSLTLVK